MTTLKIKFRNNTDKATIKAALFRGDFIPTQPLESKYWFETSFESSQAAMKFIHEVKPVLAEYIFQHNTQTERTQ